MYRARDLESDRVIALKILPPEIAADPEFLERFYAEIETLRHLDHPNIVQIFSSGERENYAFYTMEYVDGEDLARRLQRDPRPGLEEAAKIIRQLCSALEYSHGMGVIHRDIKPANLLADREGNLKIADFGLAKLHLPGDTEMGLTLTRAVMGTVHYMAPEVSTGQGQVDQRADLYAVGMVLYELLTGRVAAGRFEAPSTHAKELNRRVDEVVARALSSNPNARFQNADELESAFSRALQFKDRKVVIMVGLLLLLGFAAFFLIRKEQILEPPFPLHGTVLVRETGSGNHPEEVEVSLSPSSSSEFQINHEMTNRGDYWLDNEDSKIHEKGTLITSVAQIRRADSLGDFLWIPFGTSSYTISGSPPQFVIDCHRVGSEEEVNINTAFGYFPYSQFFAAEISKPSSRGGLTINRGNPSLEVGKHIQSDHPAVIELNLTSLGETSTKGVLLANIAANTDLLARVTPKEDGSFAILSQDNDAPGYPDRSSQMNFVYLSIKQVGVGGITALGRVAGDGSSLLAAGKFTLSFLKPGRWLLEIPKGSPETGTLLVTPLGDLEANHFLAYEWSSEKKAYLIEARSIPEADLIDEASATAPIFNFVFLSRLSDEK